MKDTILAAAKTVLVRNGLAAWTIEDVAKEARCAKGLINYHYKSKARLLAQVGNGLREDRLARRLAALQHEGATALDALWHTLVAEVRSGELAAWLALSSLRDPAIQESLRSSEEEQGRLNEAQGQAIGLVDKNLGPMLETVLTGFQLALLHGHEHHTVREAYHRFWLGLI